MPFRMTEMVGCEFPLFAFSHCRDVVAAVSRAGGFGVLGGSSFTPEALETELRWIDDHVDGKPYGIDIVFPENQAVNEVIPIDEIVAQVPSQHRDFVIELLADQGITMTQEEAVLRRVPASVPEIAEKLLDVAFSHPIRLVANALGIAPQVMIDRGKKHGVPVAALVGAKEHAIRQVHAGVDLLVAQGTEAGGHCGEVSTLVLLPEVIRAIKPIRDVPVLAAGGIMTGRQMAGMMAAGAAGAWTGSVWLATTESETSHTFREKMVEASSRDTVRSKVRTGKPCRQLRSAWHDAWDAPSAPPPLPSPLMSLLSTPAFERIDRAADAGSGRARDFVSYYVGQGIGLVDSVKSATTVVQEFKEEFAESVSDIMDMVA